MNYTQCLCVFSTRVLAAREQGILFLLYSEAGAHYFFKVIYFPVSVSSVLGFQARMTSSDILSLSIISLHPALSACNSVGTQ